MNPTVMPSVDIFRKHGPPGLDHAVRRLHGGKNAVAQRMGLTVSRKPRGYWCIAENREKGVRELLCKLKREAATSEGQIMPSKGVMIAAGRADLAQAIERHGGIAQIAKSLGLKHRGKRRHSPHPSSLCVCYKRLSDSMQE